MQYASFYSIKHMPLSFTCIIIHLKWNETSVINILYIVLYTEKDPGKYRHPNFCV